MKIITWFKSLSWIALAGMLGGAIMMILNAHRAGKMEADIVHQEKRISQLNKGTATDIQAAAKKQDKIDVKKVKAREVRKNSEASLERIGQNETMADIATRFNGKRVRSRTDTAAGL